MTTQDFETRKKLLAAYAARRRPVFAHEDWGCVLSGRPEWPFQFILAYLPPMKLCARMEESASVNDVALFKKYEFRQYHGYDHVFHEHYTAIPVSEHRLAQEFEVETLLRRAQEDEDQRLGRRGLREAITKEMRRERDLERARRELL